MHESEHLAKKSTMEIMLFLLDNISKSFPSQKRMRKITLASFLLLQFGYAFTDFYTSTFFSSTGRLQSPTSLPMVLASLSQPGFLLKTRLVEAGIPPSDIELQADFDSEDVDFETTSSSNRIVEVKTLVWEVSCNQNEVIEGDTVEKFYVVSTQRMSDRVDISLLRDLVYKHQELPFGCTPSRLSMAPTEKAQLMTGFQSGCMPPIGHTIPMKLFVDESIAEAAVASVGSGSQGHSLLLPMKQMLKCAESNEQGLHIGSFVKSPRPRSPSSVLETSAQAGQQKKPKSRCPEPKDRLKEYRSMTSIVEKAKLLRSTVRKKGRAVVMKELIDEAVKSGDFPQLLKVSEEDHLDKNALHLCSWRGDFETVKLLVETSKKQYPELDIVNMVSKGSGNYGKTPIFYALTQCRDDVVRYLVSQSASLLFVNNKGQTPCSIAVSHLEEKSCQFLFDIEAQQLKDGGSFANFRISHSDDKLYGDLDPRFEIDSLNMGDDLTGQVKDYKKSLANGTTLYNGIPTNFSPRSFRPTVRWWKRSDKSLESANNGEASDQITFTQPRERITRKSKAENQQSRQKASRSRFTAIDVSSLEVLSIDEVLDPQYQDGDVDDKSTILVKCTDSIGTLESEIDRTILLARTLAANGEKSADEVLLETAWGLDCEWLPGDECGKDNPVATLQLSTQRQSFLVDLQCLCQALHHERHRDHSISNEIELELHRVLLKLFSGNAVSIIGYGIMQDLGKLAASFPHLPCFCVYNSVIDLQAVSNIVISKSERQNASSLQRMVALLLHRRLDKSQQCSDWTRRPLTTKQIYYATLDAAVLPLLLRRALEQTTIERYNGQFFGTHATLRSSVRFTFIDENGGTLQNEIDYFVPKGRVSVMFSKKIARQCWPTNQATPDLPKQIVASSRPSKKERAHIRKVGGGKRPKPIQLRDISGNLNNLPIPGTTLGYTKDSCVDRVVGHEFTNTLPEGTYIGFNRRSGVCETTNAWIIFCNFGGSKTLGRPMSSGFSKEGKEFSFNLDPRKYHGKSSEKTLCEFLSSQQGTSHDEIDRSILLFARASTRQKYTYCGLCECLGLLPKESGSMDILFNLVDYSELVGYNKVSESFLELAQHHVDG